MLWVANKSQASLRSLSLIQFHIDKLLAQFSVIVSSFPVRLVSAVRSPPSSSHPQSSISSSSLLALFLFGGFLGGGPLVALVLRRSARSTRSEGWPRLPRLARNSSSPVAYSLARKACSLLEHLFGLGHKSRFRRISATLPGGQGRQDESECSHSGKTE